MLSCGIRRANGEASNQISSDPNFPQVISKTLAQKQRFQKLKYRNIISTRFVDSNCLHALEIYGETKTLFEKLGLGSMFGMFFWTYRDFILENLSSLEVGNKNQVILFRLIGEDRKLTLDQHIAVFALPITDYHPPFPMSTLPPL